MRFNSAPELLNGLQSHWPVERLKWFTHGFYSVESENAAVVINDLRMGIEPDFAFRFKVADTANPHPVPTTSIRIPSSNKWERLPALWRCIWDSSCQTLPDA